MAFLEHVNITVVDPKATASLLRDLFGWQIRWEGESMNGAGYTIHVGTDGSYVALYSGSDPTGTVPNPGSNYQTRGAMNHIGVVVDDLDAVEAVVRENSLKPHSHADYEPGRRFYFYEENGVEIEVVSYS